MSTRRKEAAYRGVEGEPAKDPGPCYVPNWSRKVMAGESILPDPRRLEHYSAAMGEMGWRLMGGFRIPIPGRPLLRDSCLPWMEEFAKYWLGALDPETRDRSVPECVFTCSKKNMKSSFLSLVTLTQWITSERPASRGIIMAPTKDVADIGFAMCVSAIESTEGLSERYKIIPAQKTIRDLRPGSSARFRIVAADLDSLMGDISEFMFIDELHGLSKQGGIRFVMEHVRGARSGQASASAIIASTHAHQPDGGVWAEELEVYRKIRDGYLPYPRLFVSYEWPEKAVKEKAYMEPGNWPATNPSWGLTVTPKEMNEAFGLAVAKGPAALASFLNQRTNLHPEANTPPTAWPGARYWSDALDPDPILRDPTHVGLDRLIDISEAVVIGIDAGGMHDALAVQVIGRDAGKGVWRTWGHAWIHAGLRDSHPGVFAKMSRFIERGEMTVLDYAVKSEEGRRSIYLEELGQMMSYINIRAHGKLGRVDSVGVDRGGLEELADAIQAPHLEAPLSDHQINTVIQGKSLAGTYNALATRVATGDFKHNGSAWLEWCVRNAVMKPSGNAFVIEKDQVSDQTHKIDGLVALVCAAKMLGASPDAHQPILMRAA